LAAALTGTGAPAWSAISVFRCFCGKAWPKVVGNLRARIRSMFFRSVSFRPVSRKPAE